MEIHWVLRLVEAFGTILQKVTIVITEKATLITNSPGDEIAKDNCMTYDPNTNILYEHTSKNCG